MIHGDERPMPVWDGNESVWEGMKEKGEMTLRSYRGT